MVNARGGGNRYLLAATSFLGRMFISFPESPMLSFPEREQRSSLTVTFGTRILKESGIDALRGSLKTNNREFWVAKLQRNYDRDVVVTAELEQLGWMVVRVWESDLKRPIPILNFCYPVAIGG
jgi:hypothetical protein